MVNPTGQRPVPVLAGERSALLDSLRGFALFGILVANMMGFIGFFFIQGAQAAALPLAQFNQISAFVLEWLVVGKFYSIFSLLFGIGLRSNCIGSNSAAKAFRAICGGSRSCS
jgi:uncharacterized protein